MDKTQINLDRIRSHAADAIWRTIRGAHVMLNKNGEIIGGAGGKLNGKKLKKATKALEEFTSSISYGSDEDEPSYGTIREDGTVEERNGLLGQTLDIFTQSVLTAKSALKKFNEKMKLKRPYWHDNTWRVDSPDPDDMKSDEHYGSVCHRTPGGSTLAIAANGNIWGVCKNPDDDMTGPQIIALAVKNGGNRLNSYDGNHKFYVNNGFEPVSWCQFDARYVTTEWKQARKKDPEIGPEDVIFYKYVGIGKVNPKYMKKENFKKQVPPSADYDTAKAIQSAEFER